MLETIRSTAETAATTPRHFRRLATTVSGTVEDRVRNVRHGLRNGRYFAEDVRDSARLYVRRHPLQAVGMALVTGVTAGLITAFTARALLRKR